MKKVGVFFLLFLWVVGAIGGIGYAVHNKVDYPIVAGMVVNALFGVPTVINLWRYLQKE